MYRFEIEKLLVVWAEFIRAEKWFSPYSIPLHFERPHMFDDLDFPRNVGGVSQKLLDDLDPICDVCCRNNETDGYLDELNCLNDVDCPCLNLRNSIVYWADYNESPQ